MHGQQNIKKESAQFMYLVSQSVSYLATWSSVIGLTVLAGSNYEAQ